MNDMRDLHRCFIDAGDPEDNPNTRARQAWRRSRSPASLRAMPSRIFLEKRVDAARFSIRAIAFRRIYEDLEPL